MSKILEISGEFPCRITFFARYAPRRRSDEPEPNWGMKIRREGDAADTCGRCLMSSAHSGCSSFRVNHSLGGRESEAHGKRKAMIVSEPSSRMPPSTFSFSPLITVLTVITVVMPMTMPRMVSAERNGLTRSESIANENVSRGGLPRDVLVGDGLAPRQSIAFRADHSRHRHRHYDRDYREHGDQRAERKRAGRHPRARLGHDHRFPFSVGLALAAAQRMVHAEGAAAGVGGRHETSAARVGGIPFPADFHAPVWFRLVGPAPRRVPREECDPAGELAGDLQDFRHQAGTRPVADGCGYGTPFARRRAWLRYGAHFIPRCKR